MMVKRNFGETCQLHIQGRRLNQARDQLEPDNKNADLLLGLFFDSEDRVDIVARMWRLYKPGYWIDNWIYWITINYTLTTESLTITTDSHN
jgi:hypothetical protein